MIEPTISCPNCKTEIRLTESQAFDKCSEYALECGR